MNRAGMGLILGRIEYGLDMSEAVSLQLAAHDGGVRALAGRFGKRKVDPAIFLIIGVKHDIEKPALAGGHNLRNAGDLARFRGGGGEKKESSPPFADQKPSVWELCHRPRALESFGDGLDAEAVGGGVHRFGPTIGKREEQDERHESHGWSILTKPADPSKRKTARASPKGGAGGVFALYGAEATLGCFWSAVVNIHGAETSERAPSKLLPVGGSPGVVTPPNGFITAPLLVSLVFMTQTRICAGSAGTVWRA